MIRALNYKSSSIGDIPARWNVVKLDNKTVDILNGFSWAKNRAVVVGIPHLRPFNISNDGEVLITSETVHIPSDAVFNKSEYRLLPGDILYNNTNSLELVGKSGIARQPMDVGFSNHINRLRVREPDQLLPEWLILCLRRLHIAGFLQANANKWIGQASFSVTALSDVEIPVPPIAEQWAIVIRIKQLLDELHEIRQLNAAIDSDMTQMLEAVLRKTFIDIEAKYPPSMRIDSITQVTNGGTPNRNNIEYFQGSVPWVKTGELKDAPIYEAEEYITEDAVENSNAKKLPTGTLLIAMYGQGQTRGRTGVLQNVATTNQACCAILPNDEHFNPRFLQYWFMYMYEELRRRSESRGGIQSNLNVGIIKSLMPPLPETHIQERITSYLDGVRSEVDEIRKIQSADATLLQQLEQAILVQAFSGEL